jgi:hypothetical protein
MVSWNFGFHCEYAFLSGETEPKGTDTLTVWNQSNCFDRILHSRHLHQFWGYRSRENRVQVLA